MRENKNSGSAARVLLLPLIRKGVPPAIAVRLAS
jgi:hypothetical protein